MKTNKKIIILGAGLTGLSAAWHLQKKAIDCRVFEKEMEPGGLCRSKKIGGFTFDYCGHVLHFKHKYTFDLINNLYGNKLIEHKKNAWVYSFGRFTRFPFQANLYGLPANVIEECLLEFLKVLMSKGSVKNNSEVNFHDWVNKTFGKAIAKYFMIPYNAKFWTVPLKELTCQWLDGLIPIPTIKEILEGTIEESMRSFGYNARFWYPKEGGISRIPQALAGQIRNIFYNCPVTGIDIENKQLKLASGAKEKFDYLISTIPLPEMPKIIKNTPQKARAAFKKLRWNSVFNLNLGVDRLDTLGRHWIYFPQDKISFFRVGFFHNFAHSMSPAQKSSLYAEVSYSKEMPIDKNKIIGRIKKDLIDTGILKANDISCVKDINDIEYAYPIYDKNHSLSTDIIMKYLLSNGVFSLGRYGSWRYISMEDALLHGKEIADRF